MKLSDIKTGMRVVTKPGVGSPEHGTVSDVNAHYAFVRFDDQVEKSGWDAAPRFNCRPEDLEPEEQIIVIVKQYMRPNGRPLIRSTELPVTVKPLYDDMTARGFRFEAEVLSTGLVSITISDDNSDVDVDVVPNDPSIQNAMVKMLKAERWNV